MSATSSAPPEVLFAHLAVAEAWGAWGRFPVKPRRERAGRHEPNGVGAIRRITPAREEVVAYEPGRHYAYIALAGLPARDYRADVTFTPDGTGTRIRWEGRFEPLIPGTGPLLRAFIGRLLGSFVKQVARHSERCPSTCPAQQPVQPA